MIIFPLKTLIVFVAVLAAFFIHVQNYAKASHSVAAPSEQIAGKILFTLKVGKEDHVAVINADGTALTDLTSCGEGECYPNWSPDGTKIVFERHNEKGAGIYLMDADG